MNLLQSWYTNSRNLINNININIGSNSNKKRKLDDHGQSDYPFKKSRKTY